MAFDLSASVLRPAALVLNRSTAGSSVLTVADRPAAILPPNRSPESGRPRTSPKNDRLILMGSFGGKIVEMNMGLR
jgi:hypothetical protein